MEVKNVVVINSLHDRREANRSVIIRAVTRHRTSQHRGTEGLKGLQDRATLDGNVTRSVDVEVFERLDTNRQFEIQRCARVPILCSRVHFSLEHLDTREGEKLHSERDSNSPGNTCFQAFHLTPDAVPAHRCGFRISTVRAHQPFATRHANGVCGVPNNKLLQSQLPALSSR